MGPLDAPKACHQTRMQLSGIMCERELTKEEKILHTVATRYMIRLLTICDERLEAAHMDTKNEDSSRLPDSSEKKIPPGEEPGLLSSN